MAKQSNNKRLMKETKVKKKNKKKKSNKLGIVLIFLILVLILLAGIFIYKINKNGGGLQGILITFVGNDEETLKDLKPIQVLLMGISTDNGGKLTDTIIVATYDPKNQKASLLSIPRDTFVGNNPLTGTGRDKINALYQKGPEKTLEKVNELTGLNIEYYMVIDNQALIELVDVIGGVEFYVPIDMNYDDKSQDLHIHLSEGLQELNGDKAEQLLRFRKNNDGTTYPESYGGNDYGRMRTQREFMIETAKQTLQLKNVLKLKNIIDIIYEYVETNLSITIIKDYVPYAININIDSIESAVLPGASYGPTTTPTYPLWFFIANEKETAKLVQRLYGSDEEVEEENSENLNSDENTSTKINSSVSTGVEISKKDASNIKIELLNSTGDKSVLAEVEKLLVNQGYNVTNKATTTSISKTTIINKTDVETKFIDNIKDTLGVENISSNFVSSSNVDITIIIGKDYN